MTPFLFCCVVFFLRWLVLANTRTLAFVFLLLQEAQWISSLGGCCRRMPHYTHTHARISRSVPRLTTLSGAYEALHRRLFNYNASLRGRNMYEHTRTPGQTDRKDRQGMLAFWNVANAPRWPQGTRWITCRASRTLLLAIAVCLLVVFVNLLLLHVARCLCYIVCASGCCLWSYAGIEPLRVCVCIVIIVVNRPTDTDRRQHTYKHTFICAYVYVARCVCCASGSGVHIKNWLVAAKWWFCGSRCCCGRE